MQRNCLWLWLCVLLVLPTSTVCAEGTVYFVDNFENGLTNWVVNGLNWALVDTDYRSATHCITDSPSGNYAPAANSVITLRSAIDLSNATAPILSFWHKHFLNNGDGNGHNIDKAYVEVSQDAGVTWINVPGAQFRFTSSTWTQVRLDLSAYKTTPILIRFRLVDDPYYGQADGWYIDDVEVKEQDTATTPFPFFDDFENGLGNWLVSGLDWAVTDTDYRSAGHAITDSPTGNYPAFARTTITLAHPINLLNTATPILSFWHKYFLEPGSNSLYIDKAYVDVSQDGGVTWVNIPGGLFYASSSTWTHVRLDLSAYKATPILIRFRLQDDAARGQADGWYVDDVEIKEQDTATTPFPFFDDFENGLGNWLVSGLDWAVADTDYRSAGHAITDSPLGNYPSQARTTITLAHPINLSGAATPLLSFWHKYFLNAGSNNLYVDKAYVDISQDGGVTWATIPKGEFYFTSSMWTQARLDLTPYKATPILIRFRLQDDAARGQADGWYIDDVTIDDIDTSSPIPGIVTPSTRAGSFVSGVFDLITNFSDPQSRVTSCQYTTDGGVTWSNAVITGSLPDNICTKTALAATDGQVLTLNMKATSSGGSATAVAVMVTVDNQPPTDGTLSITPGDGNLTLNWSDFFDSGSGLRSTNTYLLVRSEIAPPGAYCANGTQVYQGNASTIVDTGVVNRAAYFYRICAIDTIGNVSAGTTATGKPMATQTITFPPIPVKTYGDADFDPGATVNSGLTVYYTGNNQSVAIIVNGKIHIVGAGSVTITASQPVAGEWLPALSVTQTLTVAKANLTITADNKSKSYSSANPGLTYTPSGFVNGDTIAVLSGAPSLNTTATFVSPAGTYPITIAIGSLSAANYVTTFVNGALTVTKVLLTIIADNKSRNYGGSNPLFTYTPTGFVNGDTVAVLGGTPAYNTTATIASPVGSYSISLGVGTLAATNYTFSFINGTLTVTKASLTITADNKSKSYGGANPVLTYTSSGFVNGDTVAVLSGAPSFITTATSASPVGTYPITVAIGSLSATNYNLTTFVNGALTVTKAILTITADNKSRSYGGSNPVFTYTPSGFVNGDTVAVLGGTPTYNTTAAIATPVGSYPIFLGVGTLAATNYTFSFVNGALTVTKAILTITADNKSRSYGGSNPVFTYTPIGFVNGDTIAVLGGTPTYNTTATVASQIGSYPISLGLGTLATTNYTFSFVNGVLTVTKASLTITADGKSKIAGSANPVLTYTPSGFVNGDTVAVLSGAPSLSTTATTASPAGTYPITAAIGTLSAANYNITIFVNGTLTIIQRHTLTINIIGGGVVNNFTTTTQPPFTPCSSPSCTTQFDSGTPFLLRGTPAISFIGWSGVDCGFEDCSFTLNDNTTVTASFVPIVKIEGNISQYQSLQGAYNAAVVANLIDPVILSRNFMIDGNFELYSSLKVILKGGYTNTRFTTATGYTILNGALTVTHGSLIVDRVIVK